MRSRSSRLSRLEKLEREAQQHRVIAASHVVIYDAASGEPINGPVPATATTVIYIPDNRRGYDEQQVNE